MAIMLSASTCDGLPQPQSERVAYDGKGVKPAAVACRHGTPWHI